MNRETRWGVRYGGEIFPYDDEQDAREHLAQYGTGEVVCCEVTWTDWHAADEILARKADQ